MDVVKVKTQRSEAKNTPELRVAYPYLHEKRTKQANGQPLKSPRYDCVFLLPKLHTDPLSCPNYQFLAALCMEAAGKMWPGAGWPQGAVWPVKDGDVPIIPKPKPGVAPLTPEQIAQRNVWRKGSWVFEAASHLDPGPRIAVMQNGQVIEIPARVVNGVQMYKSGDYGIANVSAYAYQNEQFGVNFSLEGVLFTKEGEAIGSSGPRSAEQMFGSVAPMGATMAPPPGVQTAPPAQPAPMPPGVTVPAQPAPVAPVYVPAVTATVAAPVPPMPPASPGAQSGALPPFPGAR